MTAFDWDPEKANLNVQKHGVTFSEAATVFEDPLALSFFDDAHSADEDRWITIGHSSALRVLLVVSTQREASTRIISARKATQQERKFYEHQYR